MFDIAIVGAGILGAMAAHHANQMGCNVLLLEAGHQPKGATGRNFGQVIASAMNQRWQGYARQSLGIYHHLVKSGVITAAPNGSLYLASDKTELKLLNERHRLNQQQGIASQCWSPTQCLEHVPTLNPSYSQGGLFCPDDLSVDSSEMIQCLIAHLANQQTINYRNSCSIAHVLPKKSHTQLTSASGETFYARHALICQGHLLHQLYSAQLPLDGFKLCKLQMLELTPSNAINLCGNLLTGRSIRRYGNFSDCPSFSELLPMNDEAEKLGIHLLIKQTKTGNIIIGDSHEYSDPSHSASLDFAIHQRTNEIILNLFAGTMAIEKYRIHKYWNGYYAEHRDGVFAKTLAPLIHCVTGVGGKGMTIGPALMQHAINDIFNDGKLKAVYP